jgi:hypothetical protein
MSCRVCEEAAAGVLELRAALREEAAARRAVEARAEALAAALEALRADVAPLLSQLAAAAAAPTALTSLPAPLACAVLLRLPVCERARCAAVCRAWRRFIARERTLWAVLDFSILRAAAGRALLHFHVRAAACCRGARRRRPARAGRALGRWRGAPGAAPRAAWRAFAGGACAQQHLPEGPSAP